MDVKRNYQRELDQIIADLDGKTPPRLLLHGCCAPCSSYVLEYLARYFSITLYFYNPNISPRAEYERRLGEVRRLVDALPLVHPVTVVEGAWEHDQFLSISAGLEDAPEGGQRCLKCYELRLRAAAQLAREEGFDYFTTTLSISPHKRADKLNEIGEAVGRELGVRHLPSDFKKKGGYARSIELSREYDLYRQDYCGCAFSRRQKHPEDSQA